MSQQAATVTPGPASYQALRDAFTWDQACGELAGLPGGGINMGHEAVERHAHGERAARIAFRFLDGESAIDLTYAELSRATDRFANVLGELGLGKGTRLVVLADRIPELYVALLGSLKHGTVACPLSPACEARQLTGPVAQAGARVMVTTEALYRRAVMPIRDQLPDLQYVLLVREPDAPPLPGTLDLRQMLEDAPDTFDIEPTEGDDLALLHFARDASGAEAGVMHVHGAAIAHWSSARYALDLRDGDVFWCTADPACMAGTAYGILAPLMHGVTSIVDTQAFDAARCLRILAEQEVAVLYTTPDAVGKLMEAGRAPAPRPSLRRAASGGAPLGAGAVPWSRDVLGVALDDTWWQAETGAIMLASAPASEIRPGSIGRPLPGVDAFIAQRDAHGKVRVVEEPDVEGELALRRGWPSMFCACLAGEDAYNRRFADGLYFTGERARRDADGYYWLTGAPGA